MEKKTAAVEKKTASEAPIPGNGKCDDDTKGNKGRKSDDSALWSRAFGDLYEAEMLTRTRPKVLGSRECARLHHAADGAMRARDTGKSTILGELQRRRVGAWTALPVGKQGLDEAVLAAAADLATRTQGGDPWSCRHELGVSKLG